MLETIAGKISGATGSHTFYVWEKKSSPDIEQKLILVDDLKSSRGLAGATCLLSGIFSGVAISLPIFFETTNPAISITLGITSSIICGISLVKAFQFHAQKKQVEKEINRVHTIEIPNSITARDAAIQNMKSNFKKLRNSTILGSFYLSQMIAWGEFAPQNTIVPVTAGLAIIGTFCLKNLFKSAVSTRHVWKTPKHPQKALQARHTLSP